MIILSPWWRYLLLVSQRERYFLWGVQKNHGGINGNFQVGLVLRSGLAPDFLKQINEKVLYINWSWWTMKFNKHVLQNQERIFDYQKKILGIARWCHTTRSTEFISSKFIYATSILNENNPYLKMCSCFKLCLWLFDTL